MDGIKINFDEAINETLVAGTDYHQVGRLANVKTIFRRKKRINKSKPLQKSKHRVQVADFQPGDRLKEHKYSFLLEQQKV
jgi:hypothetical protein